MGRKRKNTGGEDYLRQYLNSIGKIRLLTAEEEIKYGRQIKRAQSLERIYDDLAEERRPDRLTKIDVIQETGLQEQEIRRIIYEGERARHKMWVSNLRLVVSIAKYYSANNFEFLDLIQIGSSFGLEHAVEKFDPDKGYKFSTYATWWIRQAITRDIAKHSRTIRLPVYIYNRISQVKKATRQLFQKLERNPTVHEIARHIKKPKEKYEQVLREVRTAISNAPHTKSLDHTVGDDDGGSTTIDYQPDDPDTRPEAFVGQTWRKEAVITALNTLDDARKKYIIESRYGLNGREQKTLRKLHSELGISRERVRQLQIEATEEIKKVLEPLIYEASQSQD